MTRRHLPGFVLALLAVGLTTALLLAARSTISTPVVVLLYLLPVLFSAAQWGLRPALVASLTAFMAFNYFFLAPFQTLRVNDPNEFLVLLVFLVVAVLFSQLVSLSTMHAEQARAREAEATTLYNLSRNLNQQGSLDEALSSISRDVADAFDLAECEILLLDDEGRLRPQVRYHSEEPERQPPEPGQSPEAVIDIPLLSDRAVVGTMRLKTCDPNAGLSPAALQLLHTFAAQVGLYIERMRLAREAERVRLLEESDQLKSALLSSVSHDLRTPLAAIKASATTLLGQDVTLDGEARSELLATINEEADRLNRLVSNLLDMSRIEAGALRLQLDWCDLDELIRAVLRRLASRMSAFRVELDLPPDLPMAYADYVQLDRVVANLVENAMRFAPPGSPIRIQARSEADAAVVSIANYGPAIPARARPHLFDKFYRIFEDRPPSMGGTGLGLSICKGIVEAHGGRIWVESPIESDIGARFLFTLPCPAQPDEAASHEQNQDSDR